MTIVNAYYEPGGPNVLRSPEDVSALIDRVKRDSVTYGAALMMHWYVAGEDNSPEFSVGIAGDVGVVTYSGRDWPDLWSSKGASDSDDLISYDYQGNERPVLQSALVPYPEVVKAAQDFFQSSGNRPTTIDWQMVP